MTNAAILSCTKYVAKADLGLQRSRLELQCDTTIFSVHLIYRPFMLKKKGNVGTV
jgi:hypothetical protein